MEINPSGLPTPWPIALINASLAIIGIVIGYYTFDKEQTRPEQSEEEQLKVGLLSAVSSTITATRCSAALLGSCITLIVYGLNGFQYPELAWTSSLATLVYFITFRSKLTRWLEKAWKEVGIMWENGTVARGCFRLSRACGDTQQQQGCAYILGLLTQLIVTLILITINLAITFNIVSPPLSYFWNVVSLAMYSDLYNFPKSAQFITDCSQMPATSWHTITQCVPQGRGFNCLVGSRDVRIVDIFIRVLGLILPFICLVPVLEGLWGKRFWNKSEQNERKSWKEVMWEAGIKAGVVIFFVNAFYVVTMATIQAKGLNTNVLESCSIDKNLISSKTGYLGEWWNQELVALKQLSLT